MGNIGKVKAKTKDEQVHMSQENRATPVKAHLVTAGVCCICKGVFWALVY